MQNIFIWKELRGIMSKKKSNKGLIFGIIVLIVIVLWLVAQSNLADEKNHIVEIAEKAVRDKFPSALSVNVDSSDVSISDGVETVSYIGEDKAEVEVWVRLSEEESHTYYVWLYKPKDAGIGEWEMREIRG
jgi:hypothetical protein